MHQPPQDRGRVARHRLTLVALALLLVLLAVFALATSPVPIASHPHPIAGYDEAMTRLTAIDHIRNPVAPECSTLVLTHGARAPRVFVLLHGLTNCPRQYRALGESLFVRGANVVIPRLPHHGLADRMTPDLTRLTAAEVCAFTDRVLDAAGGLGDTLVVSGLSLGGTLTTWAAQQRRDVALAVPVAPLLGVAALPPLLTPLAARALALAPDQLWWWDGRARERLRAPRWVYPRFSSRALGRILSLGLGIRDGAGSRPPAAGRIVMVTIGRDPAVSDAAADQLAARWRAHGGHVATYAFADSLRLPHDLLDADDPAGRPALVYPELIRTLTTGAP